MTTSEPTSDPPSDPVLAESDPALPTSLLHYPLYSIRLIRHRRLIARRLEVLDRDLRGAVQTRDEALAALGEATLSGATPTVGGRITAFAETLAALDAERATIDRRREALTIELAAAEADRRARLAELDARLEGLTAELIPLERALEEHRQRRDTLEREAEDAANLRQSLEARLEQLDEDDADDGDSGQARSREQLEIDGTLSTLDADAPDRAAEQAALHGPLARLVTQVDELQRVRASVDAQRRAWLDDVDARLADLTSQRDDELAGLTRSDARRRAALVDLGREALHLDDSESPGHDARQALEHIVGLRRARRALQVRDAALDTRPLNRTMAAVLLLVLGLMILRGC